MNHGERLLFYLLFGVLLCLQSTGLRGQSSSFPNDCVEGLRTVYLDSLQRLMLAMQPQRAMRLADSLLQKYGDQECADVLLVKVNKGEAYELSVNMEEALALYNEAISVATRNQFAEEEIIICLSLARVYEAIGRPELCKQYLDRSKELIDNSGYVRHLSRYYVRAASYQRIYKSKALARQYAAQAIALGKEHQVIRSVIDGNLLMGLTTSDFEESIGYHIEAANLVFELGNYYGGISRQLSIAKLYTREDRDEEALKILREVDQHIEKVRSNEKAYYYAQLFTAEVKAQVFEKLNQSDSLITALKQINKYSNLLESAVNQEKINELIVENAVDQETMKVEAARKQSKGLLVGLIILLLVSGGLLRLYLSNKYKNKKIAEQSATITKQYHELQELYHYRGTLLNEVHHRIKNNLQLIISLLTLQKAKLTDEDSKRMLDMLNYRITSIALIHEQLYNLKEFDQVDVGLYAQGIINNFTTLLSEKNVTFECRVDDIQLNLETITPLGLIWSELISNSLKYGQGQVPLHISFKLSKQGDAYLMHYHDNGVGYTDGKFQGQPSGMGFTIIHSLSRQLAAKTNAYNDNGAHFTLIFKEKTVSPL